MISEPVATANRFAKNQARAVRDQGSGGTVGGLALTQRAVPALAEALVATLATQNRRRRRDANVALFVRALDPHVLAACVLQTVLHSMTTDYPLVAVLKAIGKAVNHELWADQLKEHDPALAMRIEHVVRQKHGSIKYRRQAARSIAKKAGFNPSSKWTPDQLLLVGQFLLNVLLATFPDLFEKVQSEGKSTYLTISDKAVEVVEGVQKEAMRLSPVFLPSAEPPVPWTDWAKGGSTDPRMQGSASILRSHRRETAGMVRAAIRSGEMQPALDGVNAIQGTPWRINTRVLEVMQQCVAQRIEVEGLPKHEDYPKPDKDKPWDEMTEDEQRLWKRKAASTEKANRALKSGRMLLTEDIETATQMAQLQRFWTPSNMDWRGRVYALPHFNYQREDKVRGLFEFADGEPITEEGLYWLKVHVANCSESKTHKITKQPFGEREQWATKNILMIQSIAADPLTHRQWMAVKSPFCFLAACIELSNAARLGSAYLSHLPTSWDGSCSGLQHLCAATRAPEGAYVNLTPQSEPQDVYQRVADLVNADLLADSIGGDLINQEHAKRCLAYGIDRTIVKRGVMTFAYSSKVFGMSKQLLDDLMDPLKLKVLAKELKEHPFGPDDGYRCSKYLARKVYENIKRTVALPAQAMDFLQELARKLAHEAKPLSWTTPVGLPWCNRYHETLTKQVKLWLYDKGVDIPYGVVVATGEEAKLIDKDKAAQGVAPNFVHALDASHLLLTVNAAVREGFQSFALVHDSFGCHASKAARFHQIIREQFVKMYEEHDVLQEVLDRAKHDLTQHNAGKLPTVVPRGDLNIKEVLHAQYAFS